MTAKQIRVGIVGYGNLGRSVEALVQRQPDMRLHGIFSRRDQLDTDSPAFPVASVSDHRDEVDVLLLCLGSATDIPEQAPRFAREFTTVDTYDNHNLIPKHRAAMAAAAHTGGNLALISTGWDPGLFSLNRVLAASLFPQPHQATFWGTGVSQGHSDAIRRISGVQRAVQYTVPSEEAVAAAKAGEPVDAKRAHQRRCVVVADASEHERIRETIVTMPDYFAGYDTTVEFVSEAEFDANHTGMPHGGQVITAGELGGSHSAVTFALELGRNPDFTGAVMVAYARAAVRLRAQGVTGAITPLEVAPYLLSPTPLDDLIAASL